MSVERRDSALIDALEDVPTKPWAGTAWRVVRDGRDPLTCSASGGRWDDETFDVLYTSCAKEGAIAERAYHLQKGQPIIPSRVAYRLYELSLSLGAVIDLSAADRLTALGVDMDRYGQLSYEERMGEYPRTQEVAETAHFLDCSGLIVPSARWACANIVVFCDRVSPEAMETVADHGLIDWTAWRVANA